MSIPTGKSESKEQPTQEITTGQLGKPITGEKVVIPQFEKESLDSLIGTTWIYQPYPEHSNCVDTLRISDTDGFDYNCEIELKYDIKFKIQDDTLFTELYGFKSEVDAGLGKEVKSKCKFIKLGGELMVVHRVWRYADNFETVEPKYLYQKYSKL